MKTALRDSTALLSYSPGFSPSVPFGPTGSYTHDSTTGAFTFTAPQTGLYYLAFTVRKYRDHQLLADNMYYRTVYVMDPNPNSPGTVITLPQITEPTAAAGNPIWNSAGRYFTLCPGQNMAFTVGASSTKTGARIDFTAAQSRTARGSTTTITGNGTNSASAAFPGHPPLQTPAGITSFMMPLIPPAPPASCPSIKAKVSASS